MKTRIPRFVPPNPLKPPTPFIGGYVPFSPEKFEEIKKAINRQHEPPKPQVLTRQETLQMEGYVKSLRGLYFMQTAIFNNYAAACATDASEYLQRWPEWENMKKHYNAGMRCFNRYEHYLRTSQAQKRFPLFASLADLAYDKTASMRRDAIRAMTDVAQRHGCRHALTVGHAAFVKLCVDYSISFAKAYNRRVRDRCGFSFDSQEYKVMVLNGMEREWNKILALLPETDDINSVTFEGEKECLAKMDAIFYKLSSSEFITECAHEAAMENKELLSKEELKEIIECWNEHLRACGMKTDTGNRQPTAEELELLKQKFK